MNIVLWEFASKFMKISLIIIIIDIYIAHIAEASKRLDTERRVEMTWDDVNYIIQDNTYIQKI